MELKEKIKHLTIDHNISIIQALKKMDDNDGKLLIVLQNDMFLNIVSIGDIQRSLLIENNFTQEVGKILRKNTTIATTENSFEDIKGLMIQFRTEFMPVLNDKGDLEDVIFWHDIFEGKSPKGIIDSNIPVVIMAGGKGTRLKPITNIIPKPLVPIGDRTFVEIIMDSFNEHGLNDFYFSVNYKADLIKYYFQNHSKPYNISYMVEDQPLGTAGSLKLFEEKIKSTFFVSNCDIIIDQDYSEIFSYHKENGNELTAVAAVKTYKIPYGTMEMGEDGLLKRLQEKPENTYYVNAGLYILEPHLLEEIPSGMFHITHLMEKILKRKGKVGIFPVSEGAWMDIGEWNQYNETQERFQNRFN